MKQKVVEKKEGNISLVSSEEEQVAQRLREKNLQYTNENSSMVFPKDTFYTKYIKRLLDIIISLPLVVLTAPFNLVLGVCTFFDVGTPIFYRQKRIGKGEREFIITKFRNMNNKTDEEGNLLPPAKRVTKFGKIVRKLSLDELFNFWNVLKGDMSIIGPRPLPAFIYDRMSERHKKRTALRPGLECPRVIQLDYVDTCEYQRSYENAVWYVENVSFKQDVRMIFLLVKMVFNFKKRSDQAKGEGVSYFVGYDEEGHALSMNKYRRIYESQEEEQ